MEIYLGEGAFLTMILSAIEVYHRECLGLLYGHSCQGRVLVDAAFPHQTARRAHRMIYLNIPRLKRIHEAIMKMGRFQFLGLYHSHPQSHRIQPVPSLSRIDSESMVEGLVEVIIAVNERRRTQAWQYRSNGELSGSFAGLRFHLAAYTLRGGNQERVPIICPFALGFMEENKAATVNRSMRVLTSLVLDALSPPESPRQSIPRRKASLFPRKKGLIPC